MPASENGQLTPSQAGKGRKEYQGLVPLADGLSQLEYLLDG